MQVAKCAIRVELVNDNFTELRGEISGPPDTPYEGGTFKLEIKIPETYPFNPPKVSIGRSLIVYNNSLTIKIVSVHYNFELFPIKYLISILSLFK